jgi:SAM-dependent methyltransferase
MKHGISGLTDRQLQTGQGRETLPKRRGALRMTLEFFRAFGWDPRRTLNGLRGLPHFFRDMARYRKLSGPGAMPLSPRHLMPMLYDRFDTAGDARGHYFFQDLWAARKIYQRRPQRHVDIGSRIDGFIAHLLVFMPVEIIDVRALPSTMPELSFRQDDATRLAQFADNSLDSISSLHAAEHFGLGRYGDPIAPRAHLDFIASLVRVLKPGGRLYFGIPVGRERLEFNAHRVLSPASVLKAFAGLELVSFAGVGDDGKFCEPCTPQDLADSSYACGLFEFTKPGT